MNRSLGVGGDELFDIVGSYCLTEEKSLEPVAAASCEDLELVFLADARSGNGDIDVMHQRDRRTRKDTDRRIGRKVGCEVAVKL